MPKLAVITGTRAEYGLLSPLINRIDQSEEFELLLCVTGAHLSADYGFTKTEIEADGHSNFIEVDIHPGPERADVANSMAEALRGMTAVFEHHQPDLVIVLGDRYEIFATVQAAMLTNIPVAHIHGGEVTEGAIDDAMRHSITKMSHLHFTAATTYRDRVIQLGEHPERVFNVGSLGHENILTHPLMPRHQLEDDLNFTFLDQNILVTHHPVTASGDYNHEIDQLLTALSRIGPDIGIIFTASNADVGGKAITAKVKAFAEQRDHCLFVENLGLSRYLSVMKQVDGLVGNSSSGVIEAPVMGAWTLNIGPRQNGRLKADSVVDAPADEHLISRLVELLNKTHPAAQNNSSRIGGDGLTSAHILNIISATDLSSLAMKSFYDATMERPK